MYDFFHESIGVANTFRRKPVLKYLWYLHFRLLTTLLQKLIADNQFVSGTLPNKVVANKFKISDDLGFFCFSFPSLWPGDWKHNELDVNHIALQIMRDSFYHVVPSLLAKIRILLYRKLSSGAAKHIYYEMSTIFCMKKVQWLYPYLNNSKVLCMGFTNSN